MRSQSDPAFGRAAFVALVALVAVPFAWLVWQLDFLADDAFINFRYARNLARGAGLVFNIGESPPVEAYNLLWTLAMSVPERFHWSTPIVAKCVTVVSGTGLWIAIAWTAHRRVELDFAGSTLTALFVATLPIFAAWSTGGMETMPTALLVFATYERLLGARDRPHGWESGACAALTSLMRPDGAVLAGVVLGAGWITGRWFARADLRKAALQAACVLVACIVLHVAWRLSYHGDWVSNTTRVKGEVSLTTLERGWDYVVTMALCFPGLLVVLAALPLALARDQREATLPLVLIAGAQLAYVIAVGGDFMPMGRFLVAMLPFAALLFAHELRVLRRRGAKPLTVAIAGILCAAISIPAAFGAHLFPSGLRKPFLFRWGWPAMSEREFLDLTRTWHHHWLLESRAAARYTKAGESVVRDAIGILGYYTELTLFDAYGLVDREVALRPTPANQRTPAGHAKHVGPEFFLPRKPTFSRIALLRETESSQLELAVDPQTLAFGLIERIERYPLDARDGLGPHSTLVLNRLVPLDADFDLLEPVLAAAEGLDLAAPEETRAELERRLPVRGSAVMQIRDSLASASSISVKRARAVEASSTARPIASTHADLRLEVWSRVGERPWGRAVHGAIVLALAVEGEPTWNGRSEGWAVLPPGSDEPWRIEHGTFAMITLRRPPGR